MTVEVDGLDIEVARWNADSSKPAILLLHEGLGSVSAWGDFPEALGAVTRRTVVAYSRGGYGRSTVLREPFGVEYMHAEAEHVLPSLLERLRLDRPVLFGHSDGASIALLFAARHPDAISALVLEAPHVFVEPLTVESIAKITAGYPDDARLRRGLARHHAEADTVFRRWSDIWLSKPFLDWNITHDLRAITAPALILQGKDDEYGTSAQVDAIVEALPAVQTAMIDACRHAPHRDARGEVLARTARFLDDV